MGWRPIATALQAGEKRSVECEFGTQVRGHCWLNEEEEGGRTGWAGRLEAQFVGPLGSSV